MAAAERARQTRQFRLEKALQVFTRMFNDSKITIQYLKKDKYEFLPDEQRFLSTITELTDFTSYIEDNPMTTETWYGKTTFCYGKGMFFRAIYLLDYGLDTTSNSISITISSDPDRVGGKSHF